MNPEPRLLTQPIRRVPRKVRAPEGRLKGLASRRNIIGALIVRIGFGVYYNYRREPPKYPILCIVGIVLARREAKKILH